MGNALGSPTGCFSHSMLLLHPTPTPFLLSFLPLPPSLLCFCSPSSSPPPPSAKSSQVGEKKMRMEGIGTMATTLLHKMPSPILYHRNNFQTNNNSINDHHTQCSLSEESWSLEMSTSVLAGDDMLVDEFLDLGCIPEDSQEQHTCLEDPLVQKHDHDTETSNSNSSALSFDNIELIAPAGDISDLEWVSKIVDDTISDMPYSDLTAPFPPTTTINHTRSPSSCSITSTKRTTPCFSDHNLFVPARPRSKRARSGSHSWSFPEPISSSSSSSSSTETHVNTLVPRGRGRPPLYKKKTHKEGEKSKPKKKKGRKPKALGETSLCDGGNARRCSHCGVQKTPQWRAGPMGAKTLCNACGVRYKSGRLLPEYRPAISPTFLYHMHSNSHRKVLEMRRNKDHSLLAENSLLVS